MSCRVTFAGRKGRIRPTTRPSSGTTSTPCMSCKLWPCGPSNRRQTSQVRASWQAGEVRTKFFFLRLHLQLHLHAVEHLQAACPCNCSACTGLAPSNSVLLCDPVLLFRSALQKVGKSVLPCAPESKNRCVLLAPRADQLQFIFIIIESASGK